MSNQYDEAVSPMAWRFQKLIGQAPQSYHLMTNYRSMQEILNFASIIRDDKAPFAQVAQRGERGMKPAVIRVNTQAYSIFHAEERNIRSLVDAALHFRKNLRIDDAGHVAFIVASADKLRTVEKYLDELEEPFSLLQNSLYHSWHARHILNYYHLILNRYQDDEVTQLLYNCLSSQLVRQLHELAQKRRQPLINVVTDNKILELLSLSSDQERILQEHLAIIYNFSSESRFSEVWKALKEVEGSPFAEHDDDGEQQEGLKDVWKTLKDKTVAKALDHVDHHISFVDEQEMERQLIVTSIDHAKSQAFDSVFLIGAHELSIGTTRTRKRWYVSVSRARNRFFCLVDEQDKNTEALLAWFEQYHDLYDETFWP